MTEDTIEQQIEGISGETPTVVETPSNDIPEEQRFDLGTTDSVRWQEEEGQTEEKPAVPATKLVRDTEAKVAPEVSPTQETPAQGTPEDDLTALRLQLSNAMAEITEFKNKLQQQPATQEPALKLPENVSEITSVDFLQGLDPADCLTEPALLNQLLNKVATTAARAAVASASETTIRRIPEIVQRAASEQIQTQQAVGSFYEQNPDLIPFKQAMVAAANTVYAENSNQPLPVVLAESGKRVREMLRIRQIQVGTKPAQPVGRGGAGAARPSNLKFSEVSEQLQNMFNV